MGIRSRRKGARVENEIVHRLQEHGIAATKRSRMYLSGHDLDMPIVPGDWGSAAPFAVLWLAVAGDDYATRSGVIVPRGALVCYREWYGASGPNVGLKLPCEEVAKGIIEREGERINYSVLDPAAFSSDGGPSIAERMARATEGALWFQRADNKRVATLGAAGGWDQLRSRLRGQDDKPMIYFFSTCRETIRTLPMLQHDQNRPEDVDSEGEDHLADALRYGVMSRPYVLDGSDKPKTQKEIIAELVKPRSLNTIYRQYLEERGMLEDYHEQNMPPLELN